MANYGAGLNGFMDGVTAGMTAIDRGHALANEDIRLAMLQREYDSKQLTESMQRAAGVASTVMLDPATGQLDPSRLTGPQGQAALNALIKQDPVFASAFTKAFTSGSAAEKKGYHRVPVSFEPARDANGQELPGQVVLRTQWVDKNGKTASEGPMTAKGTNSDEDTVVHLTGNDLQNGFLGLVGAYAPEMRKELATQWQQNAKVKAFESLAADSQPASAPTQQSAAAPQNVQPAAAPQPAAPKYVVGSDVAPDTAAAPAVTSAPASDERVALQSKQYQLAQQMKAEAQAIAKRNANQPGVLDKAANDESTKRIAALRAQYDDITNQLSGTPTPVAGVPGMVQAGNIDIMNRPRVKNPYGSISTVRSVSFNVDGKEVLVPTVTDDGKNMTPEQAFEQYQRTGKNLGIFKDVASADAYAQKLHEQQAMLLKVSAPARKPLAQAMQIDPTSAQPAIQSVMKVAQKKGAPKVNDEQIHGLAVLAAQGAITPEQFDRAVRTGRLSSDVKSAISDGLGGVNVVHDDGRVTNTPGPYSHLLLAAKFKASGGDALKTEMEKAKYLKEVYGPLAMRPGPKGGAPYVDPDQWNHLQSALFTTAASLGFDPYSQPAKAAIFNAKKVQDEYARDNGPALTNLWLKDKNTFNSYTPGLIAVKFGQDMPTVMAKYYAPLRAQYGAKADQLPAPVMDGFAQVVAGLQAQKIPYDQAVNVALKIAADPQRLKWFTQPEQVLQLAAQAKGE